MSRLRLLLSNPIAGPAHVGKCRRRPLGDIRYLQKVLWTVEYSILSVLGKCSYEMAAVHLSKTYCLPTLMYGCKTWTLTDNSLHTISVVWNNCFRRIVCFCLSCSLVTVAYTYKVRIECVHTSVRKIHKLFCTWFLSYLGLHVKKSKRTTLGTPCRKFLASPLINDDDNDRS